MRGIQADVWVIHDPQPLPLRSMVPLKGRAIWRCHIDCSAPNVNVRDCLLPWVRAYDHALFSMPRIFCRVSPPIGSALSSPASTR
jgi:Trehalose synthase, N-terminal domain